VSASVEAIQKDITAWQSLPRGGSAFAALDGHVVLLTGCSGGIGSATCAELIRAGAFVVGSDRHVPEGAPTEGFAHLLANLRDPVSIAALISQARELGVTALVNNAGVMDEMLLAETSDDVWLKALDVNLTAGFRLIRGLEGTLRAADRGAIVNISSQISFRGGARLTAYSASKAGLLGLTKSLAHEFGTDVRVNAIAPGPVLSAMTEEFVTDEWLEAKTRTLIARRLGKPEEIANVARFLLSDEASFIIGQTISVNGGGYLS
jgi:3-oxoacyl-[acyl-carrier protein] reductase